MNNEKELRELEQWLDEYLFDGQKYVGLVKRGYWYRPDAHGYTSNESEAGRWLIGDAIKLSDPNADEPVTIKTFSTPPYSTDPAAAMEVLRKVSDKCFDGVLIWVNAMREWTVERKDGPCERGPTLETAICLFARKLYDK